MKICPNCQQTYDDDGLNFCLNDGGVLEATKGNDPPPTVMMNQARTTSPNVGNDFTQPNVGGGFSQPISPWQNPSPMQPQMQNSPYIAPPMYASGGDQTLPIVSLVLGSIGILLSLCCYAGIPLGLAAAITGFMGMNNANQNPQKYGGKGMAIGGLVTGAIAFLISAGLLLIVLVAR